MVSLEHSREGVEARISHSENNSHQSIQFERSDSITVWDTDQQGNLGNAIVMRVDETWLDERIGGNINLNVLVFDSDSDGLVPRPTSAEYDSDFYLAGDATWRPVPTKSYHIPRS